MPTATSPLIISEAIERDRIISVQQAARLTGVSYDTFLRHHRHLVRQLSPRRLGVKLSDALDLPKQEQA